MLALLGDAGVARASPLDFLFGEPPLDARPAYRLRRRPAAPLTRMQPPSSPRAEIPLPVPRPHFPGDPPTATAEAAKSAPPAAAVPSEPAGSTAKAPEPPLPVDAPAPEVDAFPPLPPPRPADLQKPTVPVAEAAKPEPATPASKVEAGAKAEPEKPEAAKPEPPRAALPVAPPAKLESTKPEPTRPAVSDIAKGPAPAMPPPIPPAKPPEIAKPGAPPSATPLSVAPSGATTAFTPRSPEDDPQCPSRLQGQKVDVAPTTIGPQPDARCTVVQPVRLSGVTLADGRKVEFPEHPTIACTTADAFSSYVRDLLVPLAKGTFSAPVTAVWTGPGLECRSRDHVLGAKLSAHGQGLAIDIAQLKLADGRLVEVGTPKTDAETAFETAARAGACGYFHTVLGPGSDAYHRTHWHFDLEVRGRQGDSKFCK